LAHVQFPKDCVSHYHAACSTHTPNYSCVTHCTTHSTSDPIHAVCSTASVSCIVWFPNSPAPLVTPCTRNSVFCVLLSHTSLHYWATRHSTIEPHVTPQLTDWQQPMLHSYVTWHYPNNNQCYTAMLHDITPTTRTVLQQSARLCNERRNVRLLSTFL
jgi:hypothetical protein